MNQYLMLFTLLLASASVLANKQHLMPSKLADQRQLQQLNRSSQ